MKILSYVLKGRNKFNDAIFREMVSTMNTDKIVYADGIHGIWDPQRNNKLLQIYNLSKNDHIRTPGYF